MVQIAYSGNLDALNYALEVIPYTPTRKVCGWLAYYDKFEALQRMHSAGCPLDGVLHDAANHNRLHIMQYAHEHGAPWHADHLYVAAAHGHTAIVQYAIEHGCPHDPAVLKKFR